MRRAYPPFRGPRIELIEAARAGSGPVAGRLIYRDGSLRLSDASGELPLTSTDGEPARHGDWVSGELTVGPDGAAKLTTTIVLAPATGRTSDLELPRRLPAIRRRSSILDAARNFFRVRGFLEVDTPSRVICPGLEPHLVAFPAGDKGYLITSPELHLKRLLAAGAERLVEFARAFRDDEHGPWHRSEFALVEWYRAFAGLEALQADCESLVAACASAPGIDAAAALPECDLGGPFDRITVRDALRQATGLDIAELQDGDALRQAVSAAGHPVTEADTWDELFFRVWVSDVEPQLGRQRPVFVQDYPASQAALARTRRESWGEVAERFELYIDGIELANAFDELNDPAEQRRRHEADRETRRKLGRPDYPLDEAFLAALESGMPPASGIAFGIDRLAALLTGARHLDEIYPFRTHGHA